MATSKIGICNLALAHLGADAIRSFDENNKRARMCDIFYEAAREYLLARFDWPFARKTRLLKQVLLDDDEMLPNQYPYQLPSDCVTPRDLMLRGSKEYWYVAGKILWCHYDTDVDVRLYYTAQVTDVLQFSATFKTLLALLIAIRIGPSITQDKALVAALYEQYKVETLDAWESDANIGEDYRKYDEDPNNDSFVSPGGYVSTDDDGNLRL